MTKTILINLATAIIRNKKGDILLLRRPSSDTKLPLYWQFPEGKTEEGESPPETIARELKEEIGADTTNHLYLFNNKVELNVKQTKYVANRKVYEVGYTGPIILSHEHDKHAFVSPINIKKMKLVPGIKEIIEKIK